MLTAGDVIGEGVLLLEQPAVFVPGPAQVFAAAYVGDGVDEPPVQETHPRRVEEWVRADAVGAVAVEQQRVAAGLPQVFAVYQGDGHLDAVGGAGGEDRKSTRL